jgi:RNA polymerase sigma-70 factor (ECF subfamily)
VIKDVCLPASIGAQMDDALRDPVSFPDRAALPAASGQVVGGDAAARLRHLVRAHYSFLWRSLRRLGVPEGSVEDAAQRALLVIARRMDDIAPGREKTFLFGVALRVARTVRRQADARREVGDDELIAALPAESSDAGELLDERRSRAILDGLLAAMPLDLRTVFVLHELEEMTMAEIAAALELPPGTVASRLRRARESFELLSRRIQARLASRGDTR